MADRDGAEPISSYRCCECGRDMVVLVGPPIAIVGVCLLCTTRPGWIRDAELRAAVGFAGPEVVIPELVGP